MKNKKKLGSGIQELESREVLAANVVTSAMIAIEPVSESGAAVGTQTSLIEISAGTSQGGNATNQAPYATGVAGLTNTGDQDFHIALDEAFADPDGNVSDLVYSIDGTPDPSVFESVSIDPTTGTVAIALVAGGTGDTTLSILATDLHGATGGMNVSVETSSSNTVSIATLTATDNENGTWTISGQVTDSTPNDGQCDAAEIDFGGEMEGEETSVSADGSFSTTVEIDTSGGPVLISATAVDDNGNDISATIEIEIGNV